MSRRIGSRFLLPCLAVLGLGCSDAIGPGPGGDRELHLHYTNLVLDVGDTVQLGVTLDERRKTHRYPSDGLVGWPDDRRIHWSTSDAGIATVDGRGVLVAQRPGRFTIEVRVGDQRKSAPAGVRPVPGSTPVAYRSIAAGLGHTCASSLEGRTYCWGGTWYGELGNGVRERFSGSVSPVAIEGDHEFVQLAAGTSHTCGITAAGAAYCWGRGDHGELGDGKSRGDHASAAPVAVHGDVRFTALAIGGGHTCGIDPSGEAYCWGDNADGELGIGTSAGLGDFRTTPVRVVGGHRFTRISAGVGYSCGLTEAGIAYCWGEDLFGKLGTGGRGSWTPVAIGGDLRFRALFPGVSHTCGIALDGEAYCWGLNSSGQLGVGTLASHGTPARVATGLRFLSLAVGGNHTCGLATDQNAYCWGQNSLGQLGTGTGGYGSTERHLSPVPVAGGMRFTALATAGDRSCALAENGTAYCWGYAATYILGSGKPVPRGSTRPVRVSDPL